MPTNGQLFKELRQQAEMTQRQLADLLQVDPSTINMIESGIRNPSREKLELWAQHDRQIGNRLLVTYGYMPVGSLREQFSTLLLCHLNIRPDQVERCLDVLSEELIREEVTHGLSG